MRSALKGINAYPQLAEVKDGKLYAKVRFLKHSRVEHDILELSGGSGNIANFISRYPRTVYNYKFRPIKFPIILLVDNDSGQKGNAAVFSEAKKLSKTPISFSSTDDFYYLCHNLYLIKTPELGKTGESCMEDLFDASVLGSKVDGKKFNPKENINLATEYGKMVFADKVVRTNFAKIDFSLFKPIINRILAVLAHYKAHKPPSAT